MVWAPERRSALSARLANPASAVPVSAQAAQVCSIYFRAMLKVSMPAGKFAIAGQSSCASCPVGKYQSQAGQSSCVVCAAGYAAPGQGSVSCDACEVRACPGFDCADSCFSSPAHSRTQLASRPA